MNTLYNILVRVTEKLLPLPAAFSPKMKQFVVGRKSTFSILKKSIQPQDKTIWFHAASLGEFEQGVPIIEIIKRSYPQHKIVISFFSPSGYENKKNSPLADAVVYLPLDTPENASRFIEYVHPELVFFIKYEFWPNYLKELKKRNVRTLLISGVFRKDQVFFKPYGSWMKESLKTFEHFFVQNNSSLQLLKSIGINNVTLSGDTRFDRVSQQLQHNNQLEFVEEFLDRKNCIVAGSTWPEDELLLVDFINTSPADVKFIIAPHQIKPEAIDSFKKAVAHPVVLFSEKDNGDLARFKVLIVDTIGLLTRLYNYANVAYVGGAAGKTGLHNILEPATFGVPIVIGKNFEKFPEAKALQDLGGLFSVSTKEELREIITGLLENEDKRLKTGTISREFINSNTGAGIIIETYLNSPNVKNP
ncbi:3-deoxy-D-manno-octulosonic acid transferase [Antarcticibacterium arcticum]|uniref:3-deoxy-D-manno-octulosonic acid transferase n=1 Tax=Antarcticibacterium arcticum TaxID=2585771 RepID=A0A5B8YJY2_9FLAO|nr:glycosyltransferase N-terminal domain-containing protein [Antarcticibacterium arcticum]QED37965.1 3-deoxy-D-manno-octulosonic acid transferase [Antarcticibacterium arcticum]